MEEERYYLSSDELYGTNYNYRWRLTFTNGNWETEYEVRDDFDEVEDCIDDYILTNEIEKDITIREQRVEFIDDEEVGILTDVTITLKDLLDGDSTTLNERQILESLVQD